MTITVAQKQAQTQAAAPATVTHTFTSAAASWTTGDQALVIPTYHDNQVADRTITGLTTSAGSIGSPIFSQPAQYSGASYRMGAGLGFAVFTAGNASAQLSATDNGDGSDMWLTAAVLVCSGIDSVTPVRQAKSAGITSAGGTTVSVTLDTAPLSTSLLVAVAVANGDTSWTTPTGYDASTQLQAGGWGGTHMTAWKNGGGSSTTSATAAANGGGLALVVFELADAAAPTPFPFAAYLNRRSV